VVLGFELRASCLLKKELSCLSHKPPVIFILVILEIGSHFLHRVG
jgi:hypothetical protein